MRVVYPTPEQNQALLALIANKMGGGMVDAQCLAVMNDTKIEGVVAFFNYRWPSIEVAFYCENFRWALNRQGIAEVLSYPFKQLNCRRITAIVERKNKRARKMVQRLGFKEEGMLRKGGEFGDVFIYGLLPDDFALRKYDEDSKRAQAA